MDEESKEKRVERLRSLWYQLDVKRQGALDLPSLKSGLAQMNHPLKDADGLIRDMLSACDLNRDGQITFDDFAKFCDQTEKELWTLFKSIDRDGNGKLDKSELSQAFNRSGVNVSNARLDRFFSHIDKDHDGKISFHEWRDFLLFIPNSAPGMKAVFGYYSSTVKLNAEGDVHLSEEALSGLGTTLQFLKHSLFGAITQIYEQSSSRTHSNPPTTIQHATETNLHSHHRPAHLILESEDPHMPPKPARRKSPQALLSDDDSTAEQEADQAPAHHESKLGLTTILPSVGYFAAGGLAGITSRTVTAPLDRLKVYLIAQTDSATGTVQAAKKGEVLAAAKNAGGTLKGACREVWAAGGIKSLWAGNGLNVVKVIPESAVKFGFYELTKRAIARAEGHGDPKKIRPISLFTAGGVAGMVSAACSYPLDTLKFRTQCETVPGAPRGNKLVFEEARKMWRTTGVRGYYRGLGMGLVGMFPYSAIDLFTFESLKKWIIKRNMALHNVRNEEDALPSNFSLALIGGFSGAFSASAVYPINLLRTRLQSQGTTQHPRRYTGVMDVTRQTLRGEGWQGLFKGLTPNLLKVVPAVSITYVVYENAKKALHLG